MMLGSSTWARNRWISTSGRGRSSARTPTPAPSPPLGDAGYQLVIDKLGVNAPVSMFGIDDKLVPEVPYTATDVAWYDFSARPGTGGNAVFAGHVTWNGPAVFYDLDKLEKGDEVRLQGYDGTKVVYRVSSVFQVDPDDPESVKVMSDHHRGRDHDHHLQRQVL